MIIWLPFLDLEKDIPDDYVTDDFEVDEEEVENESILDS